MLTIQCPNCLTCFKVEDSLLRGRREQFQCLACQTLFWASSPKNLESVSVTTQSAMQHQQGIPQPSTSTPTPEKDTFSCPGCSFACQKGATRCSKCGIMFANTGQKTRGHKEESPAPSPAQPGGATATATEPVPEVHGNLSLENAWKRVIDNYQDQKVHESFIRNSLAMKNLPFASQKYRLILNSNAEDTMALKMRDKIITMATATFAPLRTKPAVKTFDYSILLMGMGLIVIVLGMGIQNYRGKAFFAGALLAAVGYGLRRARK